MGYGLLRLFAFRCLAAHSRWTGPSFCGNFDGKMITSMGGDPVLHKAKVDDFQWFPYFAKGSIICRSTSALFWPRAIYKLPAWLFFFPNGLRKLQSQCNIGNLHVSIMGRKLLRGRVFQPRLNRLLAPCALTLVWAPSLSGDFSKRASGCFYALFHFMTHTIYDHLRSYE